MEMFTPNLTLVADPDGSYTLVSITLAPNSCYSAGPVKKGVPAGIGVVPEAMPYQLQIDHKSTGVCLQVITAVRHDLHNVRFSAQQTSVVAFAMLDGKVVGSSSVSPTATHLVQVAAPAMAAAAPVAAEGLKAHCLSLSKAGQIVREACSQQPVESMDQQLKELGAPDAESASQYQKRVFSAVLNAGCHINKQDIPADPDKTLKEVRDGVFENAG